MSIKVSTSNKHPNISYADLPYERYITDHPDDPQESLEFLRELYTNLRTSGFSSVRYDWRWNLVEPKQEAINHKQVEHYRNVRKVMETVGLKPPTVVLSSPPVWVLDIYKKGRVDKFLTYYKRYAELVASSLSHDNGMPIYLVQVSNELNNRLYNQIKPQDISALCNATREAFRPYFGEIQLMGTILALPRRPLVDSALPFLRKNRNILEVSFDVVGVDYYPGVWHWPRLVELLASLLTAFPKGGELHAPITGNTLLLESIYAELAVWQTTYELAEFGWTSYPPLGGERRQYKSYKTFLHAYRLMLMRMSERKITNYPHRAGVYMARDEKMTGPLRYIIRHQRWGLYNCALKSKIANKVFMDDLTV